MLGKLLIQGTKVISVIILLATCGCTPDSLGYSLTPVIQLQSVDIIQNLAQKDSIIKLTILFEDGDGDIGLSDSDTIAPYDSGSPFAHNLPIIFMEDDGTGNFQELINEQTGKPYGNNHARIPNITPTGKFKAVSGEIIVKITANPAAQNPTKVLLKAKLIDRALNTSNTISTPVLVLTH